MSKVTHLIIELIKPVDFESWMQDIARSGANGKCRPLVLCKDCEHRPTRKHEDERDGFNLRFPDGKCPCQCDDPFYNWMPSDNWYCGNAKRKEE